MSILNVEHLSHGFGDRAIFEDVSFRLLKGEHIGLVGANGEGKSTFMNIITGKLMPDEGKVEWAKNVRVGYLDQHTVLEKGMTIRDVLKSAFSWLYEMEERMNTICDSMGDASGGRAESDDGGTWCDSGDDGCTRFLHSGFENRRDRPCTRPRGDRSRTRCH